MVDNEELNCSGIHIEKNEMGGACSAYGKRRGVYRVLVGKPERERPLGRPRHRGGIILRWIFMKWDRSTDWIDLARDRYRWKELV